MHTSPSNKVYIGITSQDPLKRWGNGSNYSKHKYFYAAIKKYGWDSFKHEILFQGLSEKDAKQREVNLISQYKSNDRGWGYNLTQGGDGVKGYVPTEETKEKTRRTLKLKYEDPGYREERRLKALRGEKHPFYRKHFSKETKEKLKIAHLGKKRTPHTQATKQKIAIANFGKKKPHAGVPRSPECREKISKANSKAVLQFTLNRDLVKEYPSIKEASFQTGVSMQNISKCCLGKVKKSKGFIWKFKNHQFGGINHD